MPIKISSIKGFYFLDSWVMANIIQVATYRFCKRFLNRQNDPCGRMFDQMTQAARSCTANIAEGSSRHQTSRETELRLFDVARASLAELINDFFFFSLIEKTELWGRTSQQYMAVQTRDLNRPQYGDDWTHDAQVHIQKEYERFFPNIDGDDITTLINTLLILCNRTEVMLERLMQVRLDEFKHQGGFTENMSQERLTTVREVAAQSDAPQCPLCGSEMRKMVAKKGKNAGHEFWGCVNYPQCKGTAKL